MFVTYDKPEEILPADPVILTLTRTFLKFAPKFTIKVSNKEIVMTANVINEFQPRRFL